MVSCSQLLLLENRLLNCLVQLHHHSHNNSSSSPVDYFYHFDFEKRPSERPVSVVDPTSISEVYRNKVCGASPISSMRRTDRFDRPKNPSLRIESPH